MPGAAVILFHMYAGVWPAPPSVDVQILLPEQEDCIELPELISWDVIITPSGFIEPIEVPVPSEYINPVEVITPSGYVKDPAKFTLWDMS